MPATPDVPCLFYSATETNDVDLTLMNTRRAYAFQKATQLRKRRGYARIYHDQHPLDAAGPGQCHSKTYESMYVCERDHTRPRRYEA
jgi:hypothetical protein